MEFTLDQLKEEIAQWEEQQSDEHGINLFMDVWHEELTTNDLPTLNGIGKLEVADTGGGEGDGAEIWAVIKVGERYFQCTGYYSSWGESSMDGVIEEVEPYQELVTKYRSKGTK